MLKKLTLTTPKYDLTGAANYVQARVLREDYNDQGSELLAFWGVGSISGAVFTVAPVGGMSGSIKVTNTGYSVNGAEEVVLAGAFDLCNTGIGATAEEYLLTWLKAVKTDLAGVIADV